MTPLLRRAAGTAVAVLVALGAAGCGDEQGPAEAAPALGDRLADVDRAVADGDDAALRRALDRLVAEATTARDAGSITDGQATRILEAADGVAAVADVADVADVRPDDDEGSKPSSPAAPESSTPPPAEPTADVEEPPAPVQPEGDGEDGGGDDEQGDDD